MKKELAAAMGARDILAVTLMIGRFAAGLSELLPKSAKTADALGEMVLELCEGLRPDLFDESEGRSIFNLLLDEVEKEIKG